MSKDVWTDSDKGLVISFIREAKEVLNMQSWVIYSEFKDSEHEDDDINVKTFATSEIMTEYENMTIKWYPELLKTIRNKDLVGLRETVYHEMIHGLTEELQGISESRYVTKEGIRIASERLVQRITIVTLSLLTSKNKDVQGRKQTRDKKRDKALGKSKK